METATKKKSIAIAITSFNIVFFCLFFISFSSFSNNSDSIKRTLGKQVIENSEEGAFPLVKNKIPAALLISESEYPGVKRVMGYFQNDLKMVSGNEPLLTFGKQQTGQAVVIAGTFQKGGIIDMLNERGKIDFSGLKGKKEMFLIQVVDQPMEGIDQALVIAGSDKRGTIYGILEVSKQMGVSPWYWWADVPVEKHDNLFFKKGIVTEGEPKVTYRGIFLNDEEPALGRWAVEKYGGFNAQFYEKLFELILRLKGNFIWPAMWWASFNSDDPLNPALADEMGIVMGTSHHEPMNRAHAEWKPYGGKDWNYETNPEQLQKFWTEGIERTKNYETVVTLAMRGDGDMAMSQETNIALLQKIVTDQREILKKVTGKKLPEIPQVWALYKEVQDYYDEGMRVPDDITLLLCDDNWGNIRKLPKPEEPKRSGGYGIYYHFDYVGGPRNYKWLNTSPIYRVWEQMNLAYRHGVDRIWVVNVGDLKPMEFPISFFLDLAWDPDRYSHDGLFEYTRQWAEAQFGAGLSTEVAELLDSYTRFNSRRKPELLEPNTYSHIHYQEAQRIAGAYNLLAERSTKIYEKLPENYRDAYYQLVQYPVEACATLNDMYVTVGKNRLYAAQGRVSANELVGKARKLYEKDSLMSLYYNKTLANGKWNNMMNQTRIGYTYWQQPRFNTMPATTRLKALEGAHIGVSIEGSSEWWPGSTRVAELPRFDPFNKQKYCIEIFNRGNKPFEADIECESSMLNLSAKKVQVEQQVQIWVEASWKTPVKQLTRVPIWVTGPDGAKIEVVAVIDPLEGIALDKGGFVESNGFLAIEAGNVSRIIAREEKSWVKIPGFGRTHSGMMPVPVTMHSLQNPLEGACLEYDLQTTSACEANVKLVLAPTLNIYNNEGLRIAVSINDNPPVLLNMHNWQSFRDWEESVRTNTVVLESKHLLTSGKNILKVWALDPAVVVQRILVDTGGLKPSYLGPPESYLIRGPE